MKRRVLTKEAVKRSAERSTKASAELERRTVPSEYVRSEKTKKFLASHLPRP